MFDAATQAVVATVEACDHPEGITHDPHRAAVYVACWGDNLMLRMDARTFAITGKVTVGDGPRAFGDFLGR